MKKTLQVSLEDSDLIELIRILMDEVAGAALMFMQAHFKGKARDLLDCEASLAKHPVKGGE